MRRVVASRRITKLSSAASTGTVASAVSNTMIEVYTAAKLKHSVFLPLATMITINGIVTICLRSVSICRPVMTSQPLGTTSKASRSVDRGSNDCFQTINFLE